jgi:hypothetical protein
MGQVDRIHPVNPALIQAQPSSGVQMRKEGRNSASDQSDRDKLELHDTDPTPEEEVEVAETVELFPEHGLDLTA